MAVLIPHGDAIAQTYVRLTRKFIGGEITANNHLNAVLGNPDIVNWEDSQVYEVKGGHYQDRHMMRHAQITDYDRVQGMELFPLDHPEVYYLFWTHKVQDLNEKPRYGIEELLLKNTVGFLGVSFDIILQGRQHWNGSHTTTWQPYTAFATTTRNAFFDQPKTTLKSLGLDPQKYKIKTATVQRRRMGGKSISGFKAMTICHENLKGIEIK